MDVGLADWRLDTLRDGPGPGADGGWYGGQEARLTYAATTDIFSRRAWDEIAARSSGCQLEHPGVYFWENLHRFQVVQYPLPMREYLAPVRTELDTPEDLEMFKTLWTRSVFGDASYAPRAATVHTLTALRYLASHSLVSQINAAVPVKTQTHALWPKGLQWVCDSCQGRMGGIVAGDLEVRCARCGKPRKFYAAKPQRRIDRNKSDVVR